MKKQVFFLLIFLGLLSCGSDDFTTENLIGQWKLTEALISAGGPQFWVDVADGEEFIFDKNGKFTSSSFLGCSEGDFFVEIDILTLQYDCNEFDSEFENGLRTLNVEFKSDYFIATPTSVPICIEGCSYKYTRK